MIAAMFFASRNVGTPQSFQRTLFEDFPKSFSSPLLSPECMHDATNARQHMGRHNLLQDVFDWYRRFGKGRVKVCRLNLKHSSNPNANAL
jgi:hypothetical protein